MQGRLTTNHNELRANRIVSVLGGSPKCSVGETHQVQTPMEKLVPWFTQKIAEHHPYMKEFHIYVKIYAGMLPALVQSASTKWLASPRAKVISGG
jgi:hypothetical protein